MTSEEESDNKNEDVYIMNNGPQVHGRREPPFPKYIHYTCQENAQICFKKKRSFIKKYI